MLTSFNHAMYVCTTINHLHIHSFIYIQPQVPTLPLAFLSAFLLRVPLDPAKLAVHTHQPSSPFGSPSGRSQGNTSFGATSSPFRDAYTQGRTDNPRTHNRGGATAISTSHSKLEGLPTSRVVALQALAQRAYLSHETKLQFRDMLSALRMHPMVAHGPNLDAWVRLERAVMSVATLAGRDFATPMDLMEVVIEALSHLVVLVDYSSGGWMESLSKEAEPPVCFLRPSPEWHPLTAARFVVHQVHEFYLPVLR
jgi:hypothetical protein